MPYIVNLPAKAAQPVSSLARTGEDRLYLERIARVEPALFSLFQPRQPRTSRAIIRVDLERENRPEFSAMILPQVVGRSGDRIVDAG